MKQATNLDQRGVGHVGLIVVVVVVALVGLSGWWVMKHNKDKDSASLADATFQAAVLEAKCGYTDKDLCKFFAGWKASKYYTIESKQSSSDQKDSALTIEVEGDNTHTTVVGESSFEMISIGNDLYTKNPSDGTWWKQTSKTGDDGKVATNTYKSEFELDEPTGTDDKTTYKKIGTEKCGNLTCFKYQVVYREDTETTDYIWFDTKDYRLRRMQTVNADGTYDATFSYSKVSVKAPSSFKELGENQYLLPGESEPRTLPSTPSEANMKDLLEQYQNQ